MLTGAEEESQSLLILGCSPEGTTGLRFEVLFFDITTKWQLEDWSRACTDRAGMA
jgi:hypothetical protein